MFKIFGYDIRIRRSNEIKSGENIELLVPFSDKIHKFIFSIGYSDAGK